MIRKNGIIIWPIYFDKKVSRNKGRRVSLDKAIEKPSLEKIAEAIKRLGYDIEIEKEYSHPCFHWKKSGRIIIKNCKEKKSKILKLIVDEINKIKKI
ncbi:MAG: signal recognition particle subunit SRP19/SEC65 family protein [Nitrososphaerota archaeon]